MNLSQINVFRAYIHNFDVVICTRERFVLRICRENDEIRNTTVERLNYDLKMKDKSYININFQFLVFLYWWRL